jgi:hypothetical protein
MLCSSGQSSVKFGLSEKLRLDLPAHSVRRVVMDDDAHDLVVQLCTMIGMIMEDTSVVALTVSGLDDHQRRRAMAEIQTAATRINNLAGAITALSAPL